MASKSEVARTKERIKNGKMIFVSKEVVKVPLGDTGLLVPVGHKPGQTYKRNEKIDQFWKRNMIAWKYYSGIVCNFLCHQYRKVMQTGF